VQLQAPAALSKWKILYYTSTSEEKIPVIVGNRQTAFHPVTCNNQWEEWDEESIEA
jgi:hypothetical protein